MAPCRCACGPPSALSGVHGWLRGALRCAAPCRAEPPARAARAHVLTHAAHLHMCLLPLPNAALSSATAAALLQGFGAVPSKPVWAERGAERRGGDGQCGNSGGARYSFPVDACSRMYVLLASTIRPLAGACGPLWRPQRQLQRLSTGARAPFVRSLGACLLVLTYARAGRSIPPIKGAPLVDVITSFMTPSQSA